MSKKTFSKQQKKAIRQFRQLGVSLSIGIIMIGFVLGWLFFLRPSTSIAEKRTLTEFPRFTIGSFLDGSYFSEISLWYSDTFPLRDTLISADQKIKSVYGIKTSTRMIGGGSTDDIPTITEESTTAVAENDVPEAEAIATPEPVTTPVAAPDSKQMQEIVMNQIQQGLYVKDGAAFSVYYFTQSAATSYINALNNSLLKLSGKANVYSILLPNNSGAMLDQETLDGLGGSDQQQAISYYYSQLDKRITPIKTIETLREHNNEYLYFRTDHHWTPLGAYYVYRNLCEAKGWTPHELSSFETMTFSPFLGTFYTSLLDPEMQENPDTVTAYVPNGTNEMTYWDVDGSEISWNVITDVSTWDISSGYYCFIGGDKPLSIIENPEITDGSSCMVVKESYGNCFVPFLVDHYQTVYIVDFRYANVNVADYVLEHGIQDLILINNITIIGSDEVAATYAGLL